MDLPHVFKLGEGPEHGHVNCSLALGVERQIHQLPQNVDKADVKANTTPNKISGPQKLILSSYDTP